MNTSVAMQNAQQQQLAFTPEIPYRLPWRVDSAMIGSHRGVSGGGLGAFRDTVEFWRQPDARRIDLRQTIRDPWQQIYVRRFEQRTTINVIALIDLSGSMAYDQGNGNKLRRTAAVCQGLARFARRIGDAFGVIGCNDHLCENVSLKPSRRRGVEISIASLFAAASKPSGGANALPLAAQQMPSRRSLIFFLSDFHLPTELLEATLITLARHEVIPLHLQDAEETRQLARWGLLRVRDMESQRQRLLVMRPKLHEKWQRAEAEQQQTLAGLFARYGRNSIKLTDRWTPEGLSESLLGR